MTTYEQLNLWIAVIALIISILSLIRTRKLAKKQLELQEKQEQLAHRQIQRFDQEEAEKKIGVPGLFRS